MDAPVLNINGTSKQSLMAGYIAALDALRAAHGALAQSAPHPRDWQTSPDKLAFGRARDAHVKRMRDLQAIINEVEEIAVAVSDQGRN